VAQLEVRGPQHRSKAFGLLHLTDARSGSTSDSSMLVVSADGENLTATGLRLRHHAIASS
jgi:hypothetical protein